MDIREFLNGLGDLFRNGQPDKVESYLLGGLEQARAEGDRASGVTILNELVGVYRNASRYPEAIEAAEDALAELRELGQAGSVAYGTTLLNAATAYRAAGQVPRALELFEETREIFEAQLPENDPRLAGLYNNISSIYDSEGDPEMARALLQKAVDILSATGKTRLEAATVSTNLALILLKLNRREEALTILQKNLDYFEGKATEEARRAPQYASALAGLADAYYLMGEYERAVGVYERALRHVETWYGENRDSGLVRLNLAAALTAVGRHDEALALRGKAMEILEKTGGA